MLCRLQSHQVLYFFHHKCIAVLSKRTQKKPELYRYLWLILFTLNSHISSGIQASIFSATSKSVIIRWTRVPGASSYKITVATQSSPNIPVAFVTFGPNTVMGSVNSLSPGVEYTFEIEALDNSQAPLTSASLISSSGDVHLSLILFWKWI